MLISVTEAVILSGLCGERVPFQNRERTGVPERAPRLGWWMRPGLTNSQTEPRRYRSGF
jgi:hypothetical protein